MSVLEEMLKIRQGFAQADRKDAMEAVMNLLYYHIAPRVAPGDSFMLFVDEGTVGTFCKNSNLDRRAVDWLFDAMREEGLLASTREPITLTPLGVEKLCLV